MDATQSPTVTEPKFFVWTTDNYRAEFTCFLDALLWSREHGGEVSESPTKPMPAWCAPTAGQVAMAEVYQSSSGEE